MHRQMPVLRRLFASASFVLLSLELALLQLSFEAAQQLLAEPVHCLAADGLVAAHLVQECVPADLDELRSDLR
jgi:hypothetical protein